jgi:hypothetical protein
VGFSVTLLEREGGGWCLHQNQFTNQFLFFLLPPVP